jgi:hypothetical protein
MPKFLKCNGSHKPLSKAQTVNSMETKNSPQTQQPIDQPSSEALIKTEWTTIKQLEKMLTDPQLTIKEKTGVANVLAFHVNTLNRLLAKKGETQQFDELNLGDYVKGVEPRVARHFRRDFKAWKRTLSLKKY